MPYPHMATSQSPTSVASILANLVNADSISLPICTPVYANALGAFARALGDGGADSKVTGLVIDNLIAVGVAGNISTSGVVKAATSQWDAVCGTSGGLAAGTLYYLSTTVPGALVTSSASTVQVIRGLSSMEGQIVIGQGAGSSGGITNSAGNNIITKSNGTNIIASSLSDNGTAISATEPVNIAPASGSASVAPLTVIADTTNLKALAMADKTATNFAGFRWADATHVAFRDMTNGADLLSWIIGAAGTTINGLATLTGLAMGATLDSAVSGTVVNYALSATTTILILNPGSSIDLTGMANGTAGRTVFLINGASFSNINVYDTNVSSSSANQFLFGTVNRPGLGAEMTLTPGDAAFLFYDPNQSKWRLYVLWNASSPTAIVANGAITASGSTVGGSAIIANASTWHSGAGTPNSGGGNPTVGNVGDMYTDTTGGLLWIKQSGAGTNTGWVSK